MLSLICNQSNWSTSDSRTNYDPSDDGPNSFTVSACTTPDDVSSVSSEAGNQQFDLSWTNGTCYDEIMVIAKSGNAVSASPTGDGSLYSTDAAFGSGTEITTGEYIVYKGTETNVTITSLNNSTTYHYKIFARKGTTWSTGITGSDTPIDPTYGWQITSLDTPYLLDFDNSVTNVNNGQFDGSGFSSSPSVGQLNSSAWAITGFSDGDLAFDGTNTSGDYARGTNNGGTGTGGIFAFEVESTNYALGFQDGGSDFTPGNITLKIQNKTGSAITSFSLSYLVYQYNDQGRSNDFDLSYSTDNSACSNVSNLDFNSTEVADGSPAWQKNLMTTTISSITLLTMAIFI